MKLLWIKLKDALISILPVTLIVIILNFTPYVQLQTRELIVFIICAIFLIIGIALFNLGADLAMTPMGEQVGSGLTKSKKLRIVIFVCFLLGVFITIAEPDLTTLAEQVNKVINPTALIISVGVGVGLFLVLAVLKIAFKIHFASLLMFFYLCLFSLAAILISQGKASFLPLAFDSGGVTTGPITVPFIMALGVGIATSIGGKNSKENSFGLVSLCSVGPILAVILLMICNKSGTSIESDFNYSLSDNILNAIGSNLWEVTKSVSIALGLVVVFFFVIEAVFLKLPRRKIKQIVIGITYTYVGLIIFLTAVNTGFMSIGYKIGQTITSTNKYLLIVFGFIIGLVVVLAEPAVHVLTKQVENLTDGGVSKKSMLIALSIGVGISLALAMIRMIFEFNILYILIPGYILSLGLSFFVPKIYTSIAFDSGGVASGPLTSTFILPLTIGACSYLFNSAENYSSMILNYGFGIVAMVAMTPLITIQLLGFKAIVTNKIKEKLAMQRILDADDEQIIYFIGGGRENEKTN